MHTNLLSKLASIFISVKVEGPCLPLVVIETGIVTSLYLERERERKGGREGGRITRLMKIG